jgi:hypothetical protein
MRNSLWKLINTQLRTTLFLEKVCLLGHTRCSHSLLRETEATSNGLLMFSVNQWWKAPLCFCEKVSSMVLVLLYWELSRVKFSRFIQIIHGISTLMMNDKARNIWSRTTLWNLHFASFYVCAHGPNSCCMLQVCNYQSLTVNCVDFKSIVRLAANFNYDFDLYVVHIVFQCFSVTVSY